MKVQAPCRASHNYVQQLVAPPDEVFPLLCPVREADWIEGWNPLLVITDSGVAEQDCVFITPAEPEEAIWYIVRHEPEAHYVEMIKISPGVTACRLTIQLAISEHGSTASVTYTHTSLGPAGDVFVKDFTAEYYADFMKNWESRLNSYLLRTRS